MPHTSRRIFLQSVAMGAVAHALPRAANSSPTQTSIPLGFSLYGAKSLEIPAALKLCAEIGYDSVELATMPDWPANPATVSAASRRDWRQLLADLNLKLPVLMENLPALADGDAHRANLNRLKAVAELGYALSPKMPPLIETILGGKPDQWDSVKHRLVERLGEWAETARQAKVVIAAKPHVAGALHHPDDARWLMEQIKSPHLRLAFDFSHYQLRGLKLAECWQTLSSDTVFVHVKNARGDAAKFEFLLPGDDQSIDYATYLRLLAKSNYGGCVMVEVSGMLSNKLDYDPSTAARRCYDNLAPAFAAAGMPRK